MVAFSKVFRHLAPDGSVVTGIACGRTRYQMCSTPECRRHATLQCDFPVQRATATQTALAATCDRWCCSKCAVHVGINRDYCRAHARAAAKR